MLPTSALERVWAWFVALALAGAAVAIAAVHGALGVPRNDDWSYLRVALDLAETGQVHLTGWVQMFFIGQALLAQPVIALTSGSIAALQLFVAFLGAASLVLAYDLIRRILPPALAALAVLPLALGPMFGSLAVSFMTDIPALFLTFVTLSLGAAALNAQGRKQWLLLIAAAATGLFGFTIREYGLMAWLAVALTASWQLWSVRSQSPKGTAPIRTLTFVATLTLVTFSIAAALWIWRSQLPGTLATSIRIPTIVPDLANSVCALCAAAITLGIFIAPVVLAINPVALFRCWTLRRVIIAAAGLAAIALLALGARSRFPIGNMFTTSGSYPGTIIGTWEIPLLPDWAMVTLAGIGLAGLLAAALVASYPRPKESNQTDMIPNSASASERATIRLLGSYLVLTGVLLTGFALLLDQLWDRYLLAIIPITAALVLAAARSRGLTITARWSVVPLVGLAIFALVGLAFTDRAATVDGSSWAVAEAAATSGANPAQLDGGFTWNGTWQPIQALWPATPIPGQPWWRALYPDTQFCTQVQMTSSPPATQSQQTGTLPTQVLQTQTLLGTPLWFAVVPNPAAADHSDTFPQC